MQPDMNWVGVLEHHAGRTPDTPLAIFGDEAVTYQEMVERVAVVAGGLEQRGGAMGDGVGLLSYNSIDFLTTIFAANHLGAIAMPINWRLAAEEVRYILEHSRARVLICDEELLGLGEAAAASLGGDLVCLLSDLDSHCERPARVAVEG